MVFSGCNNAWGQHIWTCFYSSIILPHLSNFSSWQTSTRILMFALFPLAHIDSYGISIHTISAFSLLPLYFQLFKAITHFFFSLTILALIFLDKYPGVGLLDNMVVLFLTFWPTSLLFFMVTAPLLHFQHSIQAFNLSSSSPMLAIFVFYNSHPDRFEVRCHCGFELHFHDD